MQTISTTATSDGPSIWLCSSEKVIKRCWLVIVLQPVIVLQQVLLLLPWCSFCKHHHSSGNSPTCSTEQPTMAHSVLTAHPFFCFTSFSFAGTYITLWIFSQMNVWHRCILIRKQKVAFCWWCFFCFTLTLLINLLANIPLLMNISRYIWIFLTDILLFMDLLVPHCLWIFWLLSSNGYSTFDEYFSIFLNIFERNYFFVVWSLTADGYSDCWVLTDILLASINFWASCLLLHSMPNNAQPWKS